MPYSPRLILTEHTFSGACTSSVSNRSLVISVWGDWVSLSFTNRWDHRKNNKSNFMGSCPHQVGPARKFLSKYLPHPQSLTQMWGSPQGISCLLTNISLSSCLHHLLGSSTPCPAILYQSAWWNWWGWRGCPESPLCWMSTHTHPCWGEFPQKFHPRPELILGSPWRDPEIKLVATF